MEVTEDECILIYDYLNEPNSDAADRCTCTEGPHASCSLRLTDSKGTITLDETGTTSASSSYDVHDAMAQGPTEPDPRQSALTSTACEGESLYEFLGVTRYWRYSKENMERLYKEGGVIQTRPGAVPQYKRYLDEMPGVRSRTFGPTFRSSTTVQQRSWGTRRKSRKPCSNASFAQAATKATQYSTRFVGAEPLLPSQRS